MFHSKVVGSQSEIQETHMMLADDLKGRKSRRNCEGMVVWFRTVKQALIGPAVGLVEENTTHLST